MYKITNITKEVRKFRDSFLGKDIFVEPGKFAIVKKKIPENPSFSVEEYKEDTQIISSKKKKAIKLQEVN